MRDRWKQRAVRWRGNKAKRKGTRRVTRRRSSLPLPHSNPKQTRFGRRLPRSTTALSGFIRFTSFYWRLTGFHLVLLGFTQFYRISLGFTGFYLVLLGLTEFYLVLLGFTGFYLVLLGFTEFY